MTDALTAKRLEINGIVQGVGFRPFIYQLAILHGLKGEVANTATGVSLTIEGPEKDLRQFIGELPNQTPPLAHIVEMAETAEPVKVNVRAVSKINIIDLCFICLLYCVYYMMYKVIN